MSIAIISFGILHAALEAIAVKFQTKYQPEQNCEMRFHVHRKSYSHILHATSISLILYSNVCHLPLCCTCFRHIVAIIIAQPFVGALSPFLTFRNWLWDDASYRQSISSSLPRVLVWSAMCIAYDIRVLYACSKQADKYTRWEQTKQTEVVNERNEWWWEKNAHNIKQFMKYFLSTKTG